MMIQSNNDLISNQNDNALSNDDSVAQKVIPQNTDSDNSPLEIAYAQSIDKHNKEYLDATRNAGYLEEMTFTVPGISSFEISDIPKLGDVISFNVTIQSAYPKYVRFRLVSDNFEFIPAYKSN